MGQDRKEAIAMLVRECLHQAPVTIPPECSLEDAAGLMATHGVGSLLVASGGELLGIVTDRDIVVRGVAAGASVRSHVRDLMTERPVTIEGSEDILDAFRILKNSKVRRLPVLEDGEIAGVISVDDLLVWLTLELGAVVAPVADELVAPRA